MQPDHLSRRERSQVPERQLPITGGRPTEKELERRRDVVQLQTSPN